MRHATRLAIALILILAVVLTRHMLAASLPAGFTESLVANGLTNPTAMAFAPDGRLFVCLQGGQLRVIENGVLRASPFVNLTVDSQGERGLLGVAFDPNFSANQFVYVYYTVATPPVHNRVSRFIANGNVAVAGSETIILELNNLSTATNHNGGAIHFGPDGKLYIAVGENANGANAQTLSNLLGKILRINADGSIPSDNPFVGQATGQNRAIWALGLRNPFTFAFQPSVGRMFINDVGQTTWEEIDDGIAASNYGWPNSEGPTSDPNERGPLYYYGHNSGACAITGGAFYNPNIQQFPAAYTGKYFFADYCAGWINLLNPATGTVSSFASGISAPVDLHIGPEGYLYYLARGQSSVYKIIYTGNQAPSITQQPSSQTVSAGSSVTFTVGASGTPPLSYQWQRNHVNIPGATSSGYTIASVSGADNGALFRCVVTNAFDNAVSNDATLTVTGNAAPVPTITQPAAGTLYRGGDVIAYAGTGTDPEDGALPASAFTWRVDFHHDTHVHPFLPAWSGVTSGTFTIPRTGETSANVWYRIYLTVVDSQGASSTTSRDIVPQTVTITLSTNPSGLQLTLDGQPVAAPFSFTGVVGIIRTIGVPAPQVRGKFTYSFRSWSDGGAQTHNITTPAAATTYSASFQRSK